MKRFITVIFLIAITALAWSIFVKPFQAQSQPKIDSSKNTIKDTAKNVVVQQQIPVKKNNDLNLIVGLKKFYHFSSFQNATAGHFVMIFVGLLFIFLAIKYEYEPLLLVPIGVGIIIGNIPFALDANLQIGIYENGSVLNYLYFGVLKGVYPPLIFFRNWSNDRFFNTNFKSKTCTSWSSSTSWNFCNTNWSYSIRFSY